MLRVSITNHKGGVAKTTTTAELATVLATKGRKVLVIDMDPQGHIAAMLDLTERMQDNDVYTTNDLLLGRGDFRPFRDQLVPGLDVVASDLRLEATESAYLGLPGDRLSRVRYLSDRLKALEGQYDVVLIDCPPALGLLTDNALYACPNVIAPVKLEPLSMRGLADLVRHVLAMKETLQPALRFLGAVVTCYDPRLNVAKQLQGQLTDIFGAANTFQTHIHATTKFASANVFNKPLTLVDPTHRGAQDYAALAEELLARA